MLDSRGIKRMVDKPVSVPNITIHGDYFYCEVCDLYNLVSFESKENHLGSRDHVAAELAWITNALKKKPLLSVSDGENDTAEQELPTKETIEPVSIEPLNIVVNGGEKNDPKINVPKYKRLESKMLDETLMNISAKFGLNEDDLKTRKKVFDRVKWYLRSVQEGESYLALYGSSLTRAGLKDADIDMCFALCRPENMMNALTLMQRSNKYRCVEDRLHENPPKVTFVDVESGLTCHLTYETEQYVDTSSLTRELLHKCDLALPLSQCFRYWAKVCEVDKPDEGTLHGFCFPLMVLYYLQTQSLVPILGSSKAKNFKAAEIRSIGNLWIYLLKFYKRRLNNGNIAISLTIKQPKKSKSLMNIEDLDNHWNLANTVTKKKVYNYIENCLSQSVCFFSQKHSKEATVSEQVSAVQTEKSRPSKSESELELESVGSENGGYESDEDECGVEFIEDEGLIDEGCSVSDSASSSDEESSHSSYDGKNAQKVSETTRKRADSSAPGSKNNMLTALDSLLGATAKSQDTRSRVSSQNEGPTNFAFEKKNLCGDLQRPLFCFECRAVGHVKSSCPGDNFSIETLPGLTAQWSTILTNLCETLLAAYEPTVEEIKTRKQILRRLENHITRIYPEAKLCLFGSSYNGFGFRNSDMDICLMFDGMASHSINQKTVIKELANLLRKCDFVSNIIPIITAKVPIVKFRFNVLRIDADISLYNNLALRNTELLLSYSRIDHRVRQLGYTLKYFAKTCEIGDASRGTISSYGYMIMLIHFLQQRQPPVLPNLQAIGGKKRIPDIVDGWEADFFTRIDELSDQWEDYGSNEESAGELWLGFLRYFVEEFDFKSKVVSIRQCEPLTKFEKGWNRYTMAIEDPFKLDHNLAAGITAKVFKYIYKILANARSLHGKPINLLHGHLMEYFFDAPFLKRGLDMPQDRLCKKCGKIGHLRKRCLEKDTKAAEKNTVKCKECGQTGHIACPKGRKNDENSSEILKCKNCGQSGHMACPKGRKNDKDSEEIINNRTKYISEKNGKMSITTKKFKDMEKVAKYTSDCVSQMETIFKGQQQKTKESKDKNDKKSDHKSKNKRTNIQDTDDNTKKEMVTRNKDDKPCKNLQRKPSGANQPTKGGFATSNMEDSESSSSDSSDDSDDDCSSRTAHGGAIKRPIDNQRIVKRDAKVKKKNRKRYKKGKGDDVNRQSEQASATNGKQTAASSSNQRPQDHSGPIYRSFANSNTGPESPTVAGAHAGPDSRKVAGSYAVDTSQEIRDAGKPNVVKTNIGRSKANQDFLSLFTLGPSLDFVNKKSETSQGEEMSEFRKNRMGGGKGSSQSSADFRNAPENVNEARPNRGRGGYHARGQRGRGRNRGGSGRGRGGNRQQGGFEENRDAFQRGRGRGRGEQHRGMRRGYNKRGLNRKGDFDSQ